MAIAVGKRRKAETGSQILLGRRNREPASQSPKTHAFHALGSHGLVIRPTVGVLCTLFIVKNAKNNIHRRKAGTKVKFSYVSCLPSLLPLVFYHILPELFLSMGS